RDDVAIGVIALSRSVVKPFTDNQIKLVETFADQAVIAIENVRLFEAEQQRTRELSESLDQQTATSQVLKVISSSPGELAPVFNAMLESATRLCDAKFGNLWLYDGQNFRIAATHDTPTAYYEHLHSAPVLRAGPGTGLAGVVKTKQVTQITDLATSSGYLERDPLVVASVELAGTRTLIVVPMLKDDNLIGAIAIFRQEVRPFTDKQIELVTNFAA